MLFVYNTQDRDGIESYRCSLLKVWQLQNIMINNGQAKVVLGMMYQRVGLVRGELVQFTV